MKKTFLFAALALFATTALQARAPKDDDETAGFTIQGTMTHTTLEGGCWYLDAGKKHYELVGDSALVAGLHVPQKYVELRVAHAAHMASICMVGEIVRVLQVQGDVRHPYDPAIMPMQLDGTIHRTKAGVWYLRDAKGHKYNFHDQPPTAYRKTGAKFTHKVRVLMLRDTGYAGEILIDGPAPKVKPNAVPKSDGGPAKLKVNDPR